MYNTDEGKVNKTATTTKHAKEENLFDTLFCTLQSNPFFLSLNTSIPIQECSVIVSSLFFVILAYRPFPIYLSIIITPLKKHYYDVCNIDFAPKILHPILQKYMEWTNTGMQLTVYLRKPI